MIKLSSLAIFALLLAIKCCAQSTLSAEVKPYQGKPTIFLNGQAEAPIFYALTDVPGGRWSWEEIPQHNLQNFCTAGIRLFQLDIFLEQIWTAPDRLDMEWAQKQIRGAHQVCPQAAVVFRFHLNAPSWWLDQNPGELVAYEQGTNAEPFVPLHLSRIVQDDARLPVRNSLASAKWRTEAGAMLSRFCREFSNTPEGNALIGIHVACGVYGEWHQWGFIKNEADFSQPMQAHFQQWLRKKYVSDEALQAGWNDPNATFEAIQTPTKGERCITSAGIFRNPENPVEARVIDYYRCQHELVADDILYFCQTVKENWPRPILTGAFYGYYFSMFNRQAAGGHLELQRVLKSPWIDYLSGPQVYYPDDGYDPGEPYRSRSLVRSVTLHGKLWLDEYDQQLRRTFPLLNGKDNTENYHQNMQENIAALRRNVLSPLTKGAGLWFYDFGPGGMDLNKHNEHDIQSGTTGYWDHPAYLSEIKKLKSLADSMLHRPWVSQADVLIVYDTEVFYHLNSTLPDSCPISSQVVDWLPLALHYAGLVFDAVHLDDLALLDLSSYKEVIFANTWVLDSSEKHFILDKLKVWQGQVFWVYAPGFSDGKKITPLAVSDLTGFELMQAQKRRPVVQLMEPVAMLPDTLAAWGTLDPLFAAPANNLAYHYKHDPLITGFAMKLIDKRINWYLSFPPIDPRWWTGFSTANRYTGDGIVYAGAGIHVLHTKTGGTQYLNFRNGQVVKLELPIGPATVVVDAATGEVLLESKLD